MGNEASDIELVQASLRGEQEAFGHLVARYQDVVCAVSYSSTGDQVLGEDVAQETFIAAWRQLDRLRDSQRLRPWLCGIARNLARTARKRRKREPFADADDHAHSGASPFDDAARGDVERLVRDALARVPATYRETLVLYYREDLSIREISETLGLSEDAVMQRLSRGRKQLADSVSDLVERSLRGDRRRRDLVAAVLAAIAAIAIPSRVDASTTKGSTMLKLTLAGTALVAAGTAAFLITHHSDQTTAAAAKPALRLGTNKLGLAHAPALGPTAAPRAIASRSVANSDLSLLPADSDLVFGINFAQLRGSAIWQQYIAPKLATADELRTFETLCGFDPLTSLGSMSVGLRGVMGAADVTGVIVIHGFEKTKAMTCFDKHGVADAQQDGSKVDVDGDVVLLTDKDGGHTAFTFIDAKTALVVLGPEAATKQSVEHIAAGSDETETVFADALQSVNTDDSVWMMISDRSPVVAMVNLATAPYTSTHFGTSYFSMNVTDTLAIDAGVRLGSPAAVTTFVDKLQKAISTTPELAGLTRYFDQLDIFADGSDVIVSMAMGGAQVAELVKLDLSTEVSEQ